MRSSYGLGGRWLRHASATLLLVAASSFGCSAPEGISVSLRGPWQYRFGFDEAWLTEPAGGTWGTIDIPGDLGTVADGQNQTIAVLRKELPPAIVELLAQGWPVTFRSGVPKQTGRLFFNDRPLGSAGVKGVYHDIEVSAILPATAMRRDGSNAVFALVERGESTGEFGLYGDSMTVAQTSTFMEAYARDIAMDFALVGTYIAIGLYLVFLGLRRLREGRESLAGGLFIFLYGVLMFVNSEATQFTFGAEHAYLRHTIDKVSSFMLGPSLAIFISMFCGQRVSRVIWGWTVFCAAMVLFSFMPMGLPVLAIVGASVAFVGVPWTVAVIVKAVRRRHRDAWLVAVGFGVVAVAGLHEVITQTLGKTYSPIMPYALLALIAGIVLMMGNRFVRLHLELRALNETLESRVKARTRELQVAHQRLDEELRRQIADRSRQMFSTLALVARKASAPPELEPGTVVGERYLIEDKLTKGGMGSVYRAVRQTDGQLLALKVTRVANQEELALVAREAQIAAHIRHPNLLPIYDVDATEGFLFFVMEYATDHSLTEHYDRFGDISWSTRILRDIMCGLSALHERGIVHRDLKPGNVLLVAGENASEPVAKLADFGIARFINASSDDPAPSRESSTEEVAKERSAVVEELAAFMDTYDNTSDTVHNAPPSGPTAGENLTSAGTLRGTPFFMAPELVDPQLRPGPATDIFSIGVLGHWLLSGRRPFKKAPIVQVKRFGGLQLRYSLTQDYRDVAAPVAKALIACLSLDSDERPTAAEILQALTP